MTFFCYNGVRGIIIDFSQSKLYKSSNNPTAFFHERYHISRFSRPCSVLVNVCYKVAFHVLEFRAGGVTCNLGELKLVVLDIF